MSWFLLNKPPRFASFNAANHRLVYPEHSCNLVLPDSTRNHCSDRSKLVYSQFVHAVACAISLSLFSGHVFRVVGFTPQKQVVRVDAGWVVAPMADALPNRDRTNVDRVRKAMCENYSPAHIDSAIPQSRLSPCPQNTVPFAGRLDLLPESDFCWRLFRGAVSAFGGTITIELVFDGLECVVTEQANTIDFIHSGPPWGLCWLGRPDNSSYLTARLFYINENNGGYSCRG